jgi:hypothetical protein
LNGQLRINGDFQFARASEYLGIGAGASVFRTANAFIFHMSGNTVRAFLGGSGTDSMTVYVTPAPHFFGTGAQGLCGQYDGCTRNDFLARSTKVVTRVRAAARV